ncbi:MAG: Flagellar assembly protein FliH/Type secretion system HrpE [Acidobacteriaceae bacterium]|nr:Flagellar assembly protein FliH/Type secretion system HrpE [Acidobacteriaceae bacterium]
MISQSDSSRGQDARTLVAPEIGDAIPWNTGVKPLEFQVLRSPQASTSAAEESGRFEEPIVPGDEVILDGSVAVDGDVQLHAQEMDSAIERGRAEGRNEVSTECELQLDAQRMQILKTCDGFGIEREKYFRSVEAEVVKLALAIAKRILHREVMLDPLVVQGVVKVALEKLMDSTGTILRVPQEDVTAWCDRFSSSGVSGVEIRGDSQLTSGECVLETQVGRVELGVVAQLAEIEKGFFDLLQERPV